MPPSEFVIAASFTADPVAAAADHLLRRLDPAMTARTAPYGRFLIDFFDPASTLRMASGPRAALFRWSDIGADASAPDKGAPGALADAIRAAADGTPLIVMECPEPDGDAHDAAFAALSQALASAPGVRLTRGRDWIARYRVADVHDAIAAASAHLPYTPEANAALGAGIARLALAAQRPQVKLIAVDGDNTLWRGVLGEDGAGNLDLTPGARRLQERLVESAQAGVIICLASKNDDADIVALFERRDDFPLRLDHILARRVNWRPKPVNLVDLADSFGVGHDAVLFIDDNPVECAAVAAAMPEATIITAPQDADDPDFADHLWLLDLRPSTAADAARLQSYRAAEERSAAAASAPSLADFFASLDLRIDIAPATAADAPRLAQLSQRTNQFNASLWRLDERAVLARIADPAVEICKVTVADRFGDYGLVGALSAAPAAGALHADLFLLSCRALGRGVEHAMARHLGAVAARRGLDAVAIAYAPGPRNEPAARFLDTLAGAPPAAPGVIVDGARLQRFSFDPAATATANSEKTPAASAVASGANGRPAQGSQYAEIAASLRTGRAIAAILRGPARARPDIPIAFSAPEGAIETRIADAWRDVLNITGVGADDPFKDVGGRSIDLVRIHARLAAGLDSRLTLADLFRFPTIRQLARHLLNLDGERKDLSRPAAAAERAALMRKARQAPRQRPRSGA